MERICFKTRYRTKGEAKRVLGRLRRDGFGKGMEVYICWNCGEYHLGHKWLSDKKNKNLKSRK